MTSKGAQPPRISVKLRQPNPLFEKWLMEWRDEAVKNNLKSQYTYGNALKSLKKYPLPLESGSDCKILQGFGGKLCKMLDEKLAEHLKESNSTSEEEITLEPHDFEVILCVDNNETSGSVNCHRDRIVVELSKLGVKFEVRSLKVGDFVWIARNHGNELVLPYVVERKRMDDFACSIKDGRYYEQKFRLKKCGAARLIYLIESHVTYYGLPLSSLRQAAANTAIQDGFHVKFTDTTSETARYLADLTRTLTELFRSKSLVGGRGRPESADVSRDRVPLTTFRDFNRASAKNKRPKISDLFVKCLVQIKGMSVERALAIVRRYPTPRALKNALDGIPDDGSREETLAAIQYGAGGKSIGTVLSKSVVQCFCNSSY